MELTPQEREIGRQNFCQALGSITRRDLLKAATAVPTIGAFYWGYGKLEGDPVKAVIIGTGNQGNALLSFHNREYIEIVGVCDIRPYNIGRARRSLAKHPDYSAEEALKIPVYTDYKDVMAKPDSEVEMVLIAVPLHMHHPVAMAAMEAGKHVFCEKLMAWSVAQCKEMCRAADRHEDPKGRKLQVAIGHQRHYSVLYDQAVELLEYDVLGEVRHIRARWHRNNTWPGRDGWRPNIPPADNGVDFAKYGYDSLNQLIRWRLYQNTGGGLMAELGSHQLDAASIFLGKVHPTAVQGTGGKVFFDDEREIDDHVYVMYEFAEANDTVVTYSSINTNRLDDYGETVYGTKGTLILNKEAEALLIPEPDPAKRLEQAAKETKIGIDRSVAGTPVMDTHGSINPAAMAASGPMFAGGRLMPAGAKISRGYREELEHLAYCIRHPSPGNRPKCYPEVALADAVIALTSNLAMRAKQRIVFEDGWFDPYAPELPEDLF